jgi:MFS family permease
VLNALVGWQSLFWLDAAVAALLIPLTARSVPESRDPDRPRSIDWVGTVLVAVVLVPFVFAMTKGSSWGWLSLPTLACLGLSALAVVGFGYAEQRVAAPLLDLRLLRNVLLVGATGAILIGAGVIAGLSLLLSLYFQDPAALAMSSLQAGLAVLPVAAVLVIVSPLVTPLAHHFGARPVVVAGFAIMTSSFVVLATVDASWTYGRFVLPLLGVAVGLGLSNAPASAIATGCVAPEQVGAASGISNMARYVGGAVLTAVVAGLYARLATGDPAGGAAPSESLASALAGASTALAVVSALGIVLAMLVARRTARPRLGDYAAATTATIHTIPAHTTGPGARPPGGRPGARPPGHR